MAENLEFPIPEGFTPPEHLDSEDQFQAMCTLQLVDDSTLKLVDVEGYDVGQEEEGEEEGEGAQTTEARNAAAALQEAGAGAGGQQGAQPGPGLAPGMQGGGSAASAEANIGPGGAPGGAGALPFAAEMGRRFRQATGRR
jgi:hypothetical protein